MPRANRYFLPGHVWHITHRCHGKDFLLKFAHDRRRWLYWLFESRQRYKLCVLNYAVTSNHVHLLVKARGKSEIAQSMQLIAGRTAQEYNQRKGRRGAFWEDRYHATAVDAERYLARCMLYIDLNMVRAGAVSHPEQWPQCGYREIQNPPQRYRIIDLSALRELFAIGDLAALQRTHAQWVANALRAGHQQRDRIWSESLAVGGEAFVQGVKTKLGLCAYHREVVDNDGLYSLREPVGAYHVNCSSMIAL